jgi:CcmD family protein
MSYVVAAYSIIFAGILLFTWSMFSRQRKLEKKLNDLKEELRDASRR